MKSSHKIFLDSGIFKALIDKRDQHHREAGKIAKKLFEGEKRLVTTNFIIDETATLIRIKCSVNALKKFRDLLDERKQDMDIIRITVEDEKMAWKWIFYDWPKLSYTDCTSFAVMKRLGINEAATFDEHFQMAGFEVIRRGEVPSPQR